MIEKERNSQNGFKMTEIGLLPQEWNYVPIKEVMNQRKETIDPAKSTHEAYIGLEHIIPGVLKITQSGEPSEVRSTKNIFRKGDILYGKLRPYLNKVVYANIDGICSTDIMVFKGKIEKVDSHFISYLMYSPRFLEFATRTMTGVNHPRTSWQKLKDFKIPLPPLSEQKQIAAVLSVVQEAREKTEAVIAAAKELKKSLMKYLFTYGPVPVAEVDKVRLKETEIGVMPEEWDVANFGKTCSSRKESIEPQKTDQKIYIGLEHIIPENLKITQFGDSSEVRSTKNIFKDGDILYGKLRPYLNKVIIADREGICSTDILVFIANEKIICPRYLGYYTSSNRFVKFATSTMTGVNHPRTSWEKLKEFGVPLPSKNIQQKIADSFLSLDQKIESEQVKKQALDQLFKSLLSNLMTGKIRVNHLEL